MLAPDGPLALENSHLLEGSKGKDNRRKLSKWRGAALAPLIGVVLTLVLSALPSANVSKAAMYLFAHAGFSVEDGSSGAVTLSSLLLSENKVITFIVFLYIPVVYLWKATDRLAKEGGKAYLLPIEHLGRSLEDDLYCGRMPESVAEAASSITSGLDEDLDISTDQLPRDVIRRSLTWLVFLMYILPYIWGTQKKLWKRQRETLKNGFHYVRNTRIRLWRGRGKIPKVNEGHSSSVQGQDGSVKGQGESKAEGHEVKPWHELEKKNVHPYNKRYALYRRLPLKSASRLWGRFHQLPLPTWLRSPAFRLYIWMFRCRLHEAAVTDLRHYRNLSEFFRRRLKPGLRPVNSQCLTSPADGRILHQGHVVGGALEQVKGITYSLRGFLGPLPGHPSQPDDYVGGLLVHPENHLHHCVIYLAPGDYHRFHSPTDWTVLHRRHFPGELFSVNPGVARWLRGLFNFNERALYTGRWVHGFFSMTAVGATNVGSINVYFDPELTTNTASHTPAGTFYDSDLSDSSDDPGIQVKKGQLIGDFNLGSTIVLVFEAPVGFKFECEPGQKVLYGQALGHCRP